MEIEIDRKGKREFRRERVWGVLKADTRKTYIIISSCCQEIKEAFSLVLPWYQYTRLFYDLINFKAIFISDKIVPYNFDISTFFQVNDNVMPWFRKLLTKDKIKTRKPRLGSKGKKIHCALNRVVVGVCHIVVIKNGKPI